MFSFLGRKIDGIAYWQDMNLRQAYLGVNIRTNEPYIHRN